MEPPLSSSRSLALSLFSEATSSFGVGDGVDVGVGVSVSAGVSDVEKVSAQLTDIVSFIIFLVP